MGEKQAPDAPLMPCPFCGGNANMRASETGGYSSRHTIRICCDNICPVQPSTDAEPYEHHSELVATWNTRASPTEEQVRLAFEKRFENSIIGFDRESDGTYTDELANTWWFIWQAAIASMKTTQL